MPQGSQASHKLEKAPLHLNGGPASHAAAEDHRAGLNGAAAGFGGGVQPQPAGQPLTQQQPARLELHYRTSWHQPVLHHSISGGEWQGVPLQRVSAQQ